MSLLLVAWFVFRPDPLRRAAREMVNALRDGDGARLFDATVPEERTCSNLDAPRIRRAWEILIEPHLKSSRYVRSDPAKLLSNEVQADDAIWYADKEGNPWSLTMIANQSEDGPKTALLFHMLGIASLFDSQDRNIGVATVTTTLAGVRKYRSQLTELGIKRIMLSPRQCVTWDQLEAFLESKKA